jgi:curli biogenesis system outer membrane secretion channel CsgG
MSNPGTLRHAGSVATLGAALLLAAACGSQKTTSGGKPDVYIANAQEGEIASCRTRIGAAAITEADQNAQALSSEGLPRSMAPLMRQLLMSSRCFAELERGPAFAALENEMRIREQQHGSTRNAQIGGLTPADYVIRGEIVFVEQTGGNKGAIGALFGSVLGGVGIESRAREALVVISAVDARTSEIVAASFGRGSQKSSGLASVILGGGLVGIQGGWLDSPQAKPVAAALVDAWNQLLPRLVATREAGSPAVGSERKADRLHAIAVAFAETGSEALRAMPTDELGRWLEALPGIGPWSVSFVLLRGFGRADAPLPLGTARSLDRELLQAGRGVYGADLTVEALAQIAERYGIHRGSWGHYLRVAG